MILVILPDAHGQTHILALLNMREVARQVIERCQSKITAPSINQAVVFRMGLSSHNQIIEKHGINESPASCSAILCREQELHNSWNAGAAIGFILFGWMHAECLTGILLMQPDEFPVRQCETVVAGRNKNGMLSDLLDLTFCRLQTDPCRECVAVVFIVSVVVRMCFQHRFEDVRCGLKTCGQIPFLADFSQSSLCLSSSQREASLRKINTTSRRVTY